MKTLIAIVFIAVSISVSAQQRAFPDGIYLDMLQLQNGTPAFNTHTNIALKDDQYSLSSDIDSLNRKYFQNKVIAYVRNDSIFLNSRLLGHLQPGFSLAVTRGTYLVFTAKMTHVEIDKYSRNGFIINNIVGCRTGPVSNYVAIGWLGKGKPYAYVLSLKTGRAKLLTTDYLHQRLKENPELWSQYDSEPLQSDVDLYMKYFNLLNERL